MNYFLLPLVAVFVAASFYVSDNTLVKYWRGQVAAQFNRTWNGQVANASVFKLDVPYHRQEHTLSCEVASLKMALGGVGVNVPESELISALPFDNTPRANGVWGNPYQAFVGDINGKMLTTGYGVYWDPIARLGLRYRRTEVIHNGSLNQLIYHLHQGRPVVVWGFYGRGERYQWQAADGGLVNAVNGEHARTLIGYTGSATNPESLILLDPIYGELNWSVNDFLSNWAALENGAVAVYQNPRWVRSYNDPVVWEISPDGATRHALAMDWQTFIAGGGLGEGIQLVSQEWLNNLEIGQIYTTLP